MFPDYRLKFIFRYLLAFSAVTALLMQPAAGTWVGWLLTWDFEPFSSWALNQAPLVLNSLAIVLFLLVMEHTVGYGRHALTELSEIREMLPRWLKGALVVLAAGLALLNLHFLIAYLLDVMISLDLSRRYLQFWSSEQYTFIVLLPVSFLNFCFSSLLTTILLVSHIRLPQWGRIPLPGKALTQTQSFDFDPSSKEYKIKRKAEEHLEKGRILKAARLFESLGREYHYRAGKLYHQKRYDEDANRAFGAAGDFYLRRNNFTRSGDAYYFGCHFEKAADTYARYSQPQVFLAEKEALLQMIRRWGESLFRLGRFMETAELYLSHNLHKLAGESYEKAARPKEAAEAYGKAGAFESSFKALMDSGHHQLAQIEKGKHHLQRNEFLQAAREFEKGNHFNHAAECYIKANINGKAARCYLLAGKPATAAELFLTAGEEYQALNCYEVLEDYDKAAQLAAHMGLQDKQAFYYKKGGHFVPAARAYLMIYETDNAVACLSEINLSDEHMADECANLLTLLYQQNRLQEALTCAHGLLEGKKAKKILAPLLIVLGQIHEKMGNMEKAKKFYFQVANLMPKNEDYVGHARRIAARLNQPFKAKMESSTGDSKKKNERNSLPKESRLAKQLRQPLPLERTMMDREKLIAGEDITLTMDEQTVYDLTEAGSLKRYQVIKELGRGGMGFVYKARDKKLKRFVALKMLHPEMNNEPRVVLFFKREAISIASLNHPNLVSLYDMGKEKGCFYMVMEYLEGSTLRAYVKKNPSVLRKHLIAIWLQVCDGLKYAHSKGIIHRDVKPSNIMITRGRRIKILDFGLAKAVTDINQTQQLWGTPSFMAPELFQGVRAGFHTDIYGLGATFFMLACGQEPFSMATLGRKFAGDGLPTSPNKIDPRVPKPLAETILRCMYVNPEERFQSVDELMSELKLLEQKLRR